MKDDDVMKVLSGCGWLIAIMLFGCAIAIGLAAHNFWVGVGVWFSLSITIGGTYCYIMHDDFRTYSWTWGSFAILLILFAQYGELGKWWWLAAWLLTTFSHGGVGIYAREQKRPWHGTVAGALALLSIGAGLSQPGQIAGLIGVEADAQTAPLSPNWTSIGIWVLLIVGFVFLILGWIEGYIKTEGKTFATLISIGIGLLIWSTWLSGLRGGWWWAVPWGLAALMIAHAARELHEYYERGAAAFGFVVATLCLAIGIGAPYLAGRGWSLTMVGKQETQPTPLSTLSQAEAAATQLAQAVQTATAAAQPTMQPTMTPTARPAATATLLAQTPVAGQPAMQAKIDNGAAQKALQEFLLAAVKSIWGIFHLIMVALLGYSWSQRGWGAIVVPLVLLAAVWLAAGLSSPVAETLTHIISSSPAGWMRDLLRFSVEQFGHAGWGTVFLGAAVSLALLPVSQQIIVARYRMKHLPLVKQLLGTKIAYEYMEKSGASPLLMAVNTIINPVVLFGLFIALWIGLQQMAQTGDVSLAAWGIPNLAAPNWKPVWQFPYFALAAALALVQIVLIPLKRKFDVLVSGVAGEVNAGYILIGTFVLALFVPAGVLLFLTGQAVVQLLLVPLAGRQVLRLEAEEKRRQEEQRCQEDLRRRALEHSRKEEERRREAERRREEEQKRKEKSVWISPSPLVAMLAAENTLWYLREDGDIVRQAGEIQKFSLPITRGQTLFGLREDQLLVIGNGKEALWIDGRSGDTQKKVSLSTPNDMAVLNPYKTMLAWVNVSAGRVAVLSLEAGKEFILLDGLNLAPALAFSADGRYLALGGADGIIHQVDFATRKVVATLAPPEPSQRQAVRSLFSRKDGGWVSVYADRQIVFWNAERQVEKGMKPRRRIMALDFHVATGRLALGLSDGILQVFDADLNRVFDETAQEKEISYVCFSQNGRGVFTIGDKTEVRRVDL